MSFIYENDELIKLLIAEGSKSLNKQGQASPASTPTINPDTYNLAKTLLVGLQKSIDPQNAPKESSPIGVKDPSITDLTANVSNLMSLGDFLQWAAAKQLTWKGERFAWGPDKDTVDPKTGAKIKADPHPDGAWVFTVKKIDRSSRDPDTREPQYITAYADKEPLVAYLSTLRDEASSGGSEKKVFQVMLSKIIGQVNEFLTSAGENPIDTKSKPEDKKSDLNPEAIVDGFASNILDPSTALVGANAAPTFLGTNPANQLRVKHLLDLGAFTSWLRDKQIVVAGIAGKPATKPGVLDPEGDPCSALYILFQRAQYLSSIAPGAEKASPGYTKMITLYQKQLQEFGKNFKGKDGNPCTVTSAGTGISSTDGKPGGNEYAKWDGGAGVGGKGDPKVTGQLIDQMVMALPLNIQEINFHKISQFFMLYNQLLADSKSVVKSEVQNAMNQSYTSMSTASGLTTGKNSFSMFAGPSEVVEWLQPPQGNKYMPFLSHLKAILSNTRTVLGVFYDSYKDMFNSEQRAHVEAQIAEPNSIYKNNWNKLRALESRVKEVISFK